MKISLHAIGRSTGRKIPIGQLGEADKIPRAAIERLKASGFRQFVDDEAGIARMATEALLDTLRQSAVPANEIDAVVIGTDSYWEIAGEDVADCGHVNSGEPLIYCALRAGLLNAYPYASGMSGCANSLASLNLAASLVRCRQHTNVAVVLADRMKPGSSRIMKSDLGIFSDIAASFVVSVGHSGYQVKSIVTHACLPLLSYDSESDARSGTKQLIYALEEFRAKIETQVGTLGQYDIVIMDNLSEEMKEFVCYALSLEPSRMRLSSKADNGHAFSVDWLLSLQSLKGTGELKPGLKIGIINLGSFVFDFADLEVT